LVKNIEGSQTKYGPNSSAIDIDLIYNKIAPYLSNPEIIKQFLDKYINVSSDKIVELIENKIKGCDPISITDFRILLNSIQ
jgi:hypothetical protein